MQKILKEINTISKKIARPLVFMELCGTHTESIAQHGIKKLLPKNIKLLSGPGCPVCVTDQRDINAVITLALKGISIACYGDTLRVPGTITNKKTNTILNLDKTREMGSDITEIYSVDEALKLKEKKQNLVFFGLGFETTTPMTANAIKKGLMVYSSHKTFVPAMSAILATPNLKIDGFINPGHVSAIIGTKPYLQFKIPQVIAGFEAEDVLITIYMLLKQIAEKRTDVENEYSRLVKLEGNKKARKLINEVFETSDAYWRGIGKIPNSGLEIRSKYRDFDAKIKYKKILEKSNLNTQPNPSGCICGAILRGLKEPKDCKLFNKKCTSENPIGACMVSSEGACGIEAKYI